MINNSIVWGVGYIGGYGFGVVGICSHSRGEDKTQLKIKPNLYTWIRPMRPLHYIVHTSISRNAECRSALEFPQFRCFSNVLDAFNMPMGFFGSCSRGNRLEWISFIITFGVALSHHFTTIQIYLTHLLVQPKCVVDSRSRTLIPNHWRMHFDHFVRRTHNYWLNFLLFNYD